MNTYDFDAAVRRWTRELQQALVVICFLFVYDTYGIDAAILDCGLSSLPEFGAPCR